MKFQRSILAILAVGGLPWAAAGCFGEVSPRAAVRGRVTLDGTPLPNGLIEFIPLDKQKGQPGGSAIENGLYAINADKGLFEGDYQVQIRADRPTGKKEWDGMGDERWPASKKHYVDVMESAIPARYNDRTTLKATIARGKVNECNFDLQTGKK
jgi:hypothetical protein